MQVVDPASGEVLAQTDESGGPLAIPDNPQAIVRVDTGTRINGEAHG
jgi:hypothetical protein